jgi:rhodanese-related sulfurtransferase
MADEITPRELQERRLKKKDKYIIIDVRESDEIAVKGIDVKESKIFGASNIPIGRLLRDSRNGDLDDLRQITIYTYSSDGFRGNIAADILNKQGFHAINIHGGFFAWKEEEQRRKTAEEQKKQ